MHDKEKTLRGRVFLARGYHMSAVGRGEGILRDYIKHQETENKYIKQLELFCNDQVKQDTFRPISDRTHVQTVNAELYVVRFLLILLLRLLKLA